MKTPDFSLIETTGTTALKEKAVCILGMHRSGTSTLTRAINFLGAYLGEETDILSPADDNPEGFWERIDICNVHDRLLAALKRQWHTAAPLPEGWHLAEEVKPYKDELISIVRENLLGHPLWAWKDPRTCLLFPLWKDILKENGVDVVCVFAIRNPNDVANSLHKRDGIPVEKAYGMWFNHNILALQAAKTLPTTFISYDKFLEDWKAELRKCTDIIGIPWPADNLTLELRMSAFIRPDLRHSQSSVDGLRLAPAPVRELYQWLLDMASSLPNPTLSSCEIVERLSRQFYSYASFYQSDLSKLFEMELSTSHYQHQQSLVHADLEQRIAAQTAKLEQLEFMLVDANRLLAERDDQLSTINQQTTQLNQDINQRNQQIKELQQQKVQLDQQLNQLNQQVTELSRQNCKTEQNLTSTSLQLAQQIRETERTQETIREILDSWSWKVTAPIRVTLKSLLWTKTVIPAVASNPAKFLSPQKVKIFLEHSKHYGFKDALETGSKSVLRESIAVAEKVPFIAPVFDLQDSDIVTMEDVSVSVVIPTKNGGEDFRQFLSIIRSQKGFKKLEIVVVDSGSTDETAEYAKAAGAKIIHILPEEFSHSYARNLGAEHATSKFLFFTVQDAFFPSDRFLLELFSVYKANNVAAVSCAEYPKEDADLFYRCCCWNHYEFLELNQGDRICERPKDENFITLRKNGQLSDIANFIPRDLFMKYRYRDDYAEDLDLGIRLIRDDLKIAFLSTIKVIHSHNRPAYYYLKRGHVDQIFLTRKFDDYPITAIPAANLPQDIVCSYTVMADLVTNNLSRLSLPCSTSTIVDSIREYLEEQAVRSIVADLSIGNDYADQQFISFIGSVNSKCLSGHEAAPEYRCQLVRGMVDFFSTISRYLQISTEEIDETCLNELKFCLFKAFALLCGVGIANSFLRDPDTTQAMLDKLGVNLRAGV